MSNQNVLKEKLESFRNEVYKQWPEFKKELESSHFENMNFRSELDAKCWIIAFLEMKGITYTTSGS